MKNAKNLVALLKDGELTEEERAIIEEEIKLNPELEDELAKYDHLDKILARARSFELTASPFLEDRITESLKSNVKKREWPRFFKEFVFTSRKYTLEVVGATVVALLVLFAVFRFMPELPTTRGITANGELEISKAVPIAPEKLYDTDTEGLASSMESMKTEEAVEEDKSVVPYPIYEEPEDVTLPLVKEKLTDKKPGTAVSPDLEKTHIYSGKVAVRSPAGEGKTKDLSNGFKGRDVPGGEGKGSTKTLIFTATDESGRPINLIIYTDNPDKVRYDIENKAMELSAGYRDEKNTGGNYTVKEKKEKNKTIYEMKRSSRNIHIPQERVKELLTYIESNYPPTKSQIEELDIDEKKSLLNIEFTIPKESD